MLTSKELPVAVYQLRV